MIVRALSGAVYVGLIVGSILLGPSYFICLMGVFALLGVNELQKILSNVATVSLPARILDLVLVAGAFIMYISIGNSYSTYSNLTFAVLFIYCFLYLPVRITVAVLSKDDNPARAFMYSVFSLVYVALPLFLISFIGASWHIVLVTFIIIWLNDTGAYLAGSAFGKTKLCERLSPKKTWEGFWGGFVLSAIAGGLGLYLFNPAATWYIACIGVVYGMIVSVFGTFGDLFESLIKRRLGVKDSGNLIPGHGGILDRIDSLLAVAPFAFLLAIFF